MKDDPRTLVLFTFHEIQGERILHVSAVNFLAGSLLPDPDLGSVGPGLNFRELKVDDFSPPSFLGQLRYVFH